MSLEAALEIGESPPIRLPSGLAPLERRRDTSSTWPLETAVNRGGSSPHDFASRLGLRLTLIRGVGAGDGAAATGGDCGAGGAVEVLEVAGRGPPNSNVNSPRPDPEADADDEPWELKPSSMLTPLGSKNPSFQ